MNEMRLLEEFRAVVAPPDPGTLAQARARVLDGATDGQASRRARWPGPPGSWPKLAVAGLAAAATATAVTVTLAGPGGAPAHPGAAPSSAKELAYQVADVAATRPYVRPGQWVYIKEKVTGGFTPSGGSTLQGWATADGTRSAARDLTGPHKGKLFFIPCPPWAKGPHGGCQAGMALTAASGSVLVPMPVTYAALRSLPRSPAALDRYLASLPLRDGPAPFQEFDIIKALLFVYVMPPALTAELYRALGDIPGVTVDRHAVDVAGRAGIAFQITAPRMPWADAPARSVVQLVLNPKTYDLMGQQTFDTEQRRFHGPRHVTSGSAILKTALVSGPGILP